MSSSSVAGKASADVTKDAFPIGRGFLSWLLQRLSGLALSICLIVHIASAHLARTGVVDANFVSNRNSAHAAALAFYGVFIVAGIFHGLNGLWGIILDYGPRHFILRVIAIALWLIGIAMTLWGFLILNALLVF